MKKYGFKNPPVTELLTNSYQCWPRIKLTAISTQIILIVAGYYQILVTFRKDILQTPCHGRTQAKDTLTFTIEQLSDLHVSENIVRCHGQLLKIGPAVPRWLQI